MNAQTNKKRAMADAQPLVKATNKLERDFLQAMRCIPRKKQISVLRRTLAVVVLGTLLASCATLPPSAEQTRSAPTASLLAYQTPSDGDATLIVTRDVGMMGSACAIAVYVDGKDAAHLRTGERATFHIPSGSRVLGIGPVGRGICSIGWSRREIDAVFAPKQTRNFRVALDANDFTFGPTTF